MCQRQMYTAAFDVCRHSTCVECIASHLANYAAFDGVRGTTKTKQRFCTMADFPNVTGCIDCTRVKVIAPSQNEHEYVNRKAYHSINVQLINFVVRTSRFSTGSSVARVRPRCTDCSGELGFPCV